MKNGAPEIPNRALWVGLERTRMMPLPRMGVFGEPLLMPFVTNLMVMTGTRGIGGSLLLPFATNLIVMAMNGSLWGGWFDSGRGVRACLPDRGWRGAAAKPGGFKGSLKHLPRDPRGFRPQRAIGAQRGGGGRGAGWGCPPLWGFTVGMKIYMLSTFDSNHCRASLM